ncbi:hypothetical protein AcW1_006925 [Taiwanofungus camphoratus]|nr:hypothetical protein AcV5_010450 [Antrodia cinnamomea]KAI0955306.1 hypothetical protein AcW1_006925 [Antrodia cinnamomea]
MSLTALPNTLLLLVHLHLLAYPQKDTSGYDEHLFDPSHTGIRERTKAMEDISHFLVGKVAGGRQHANSILPMYPCLQPSDTTTFRISLAKYLETLRHDSIQSARLCNPGARSDSMVKEQFKTTGAAAWWWKDVVVRKSLLEECTGDRFERLILALSTHALLNNLSVSSSSLLEHAASNHIEVLSTLPQTYTALLASAQAERHSWERTASLLVRRQLDLALLRERLANPESLAPSKYDHLSTDRLIALRDLQYQDLVHNFWKREGSNALHFLIDAASLQTSQKTSTVVEPMLSLSSPTPITGPPKVKAAAPVLPPEPLPVAAAHHPARMHALSTPVFSSTALAPANASNRRSAGAVKEVAEHGVAERIEAADRTQQALQETLVRADAMRLELRNRLNKMQVTRNTPLPPISSDGLESDLWQYAPRKGIDFRTPPTPALLTTFSLCPSPSESVVEERIAHIRSIILPQYPPFPSLPSSTSPPLPSSPSAAALVSRLRQPSERSDWQVPTSVHAADTDATKTSVAQVKGPAQNITHSRKSHSTFTPQEKLIPPFLNRHKVMAAKSLKFVGVGKSAVQSNPTTREGLRTSRRMSRTASKSRARRSVVIPGTRRDTLDEEIDRIINSVEDGSPSFQHEGDTTPRTQRKGGTVSVPLSTVKKSAARPTFGIERYTADVPLLGPRLEHADGNEALLDTLTTETDHHYPRGCEDEDERAWTDEDPDDAGAGLVSKDAEEGQFHEGQSITLRNILLKAQESDMTQYDLLGVDLNDEPLEWE